MVNCCVPFCDSSNKKKKDGYPSFHEFPSDVEQLTKWLVAVGRDDFIPNFNSNSSKICGKHFKESDFVRFAKRSSLRRGAVPSIFPKPPHGLFEDRTVDGKKTVLDRSTGNKGLQKDAKQDDKFSSDAGPSVDVESDTNLLLTAAASDMVVELDPTTFVPSDSEEPDPSDLCEAGPSSRVEPDSSMMEDEHLAMTCEVYPVKTEPDSPSMDIRIKEEPEDTFKQDILSATVERELYHFTKDTPPAISDEDSLFQPPVLIKEEPVSSEEDL